VGCGSDPPSFDFEPLATVPPTTANPREVPPTSSSSSATTGTTIAATASAWTDATGNLAGLDAECGNLHYLSAHPGRDVLIAGVAGQGLWASKAGAPKWERLGSASGSHAIDNRATAIVYDPKNPDRFWESGIYGAGVFETTNGGATFRRLGGVEHSDLVSVDLSDAQRRTLLSGTHELRQVLRSLDGGKTWQDITARLPEDVGLTSSPHVVDANTYLVGTRAGSNAGVWRSTDRGKTWSSVYSGSVAGRPLVASSDGRLYWLLEQGEGVITSNDKGATWTEQPAWGPTVGPGASLIELPDGRLATIGPANVVISDDQGVSWRAVGPQLPYAPSGLTYSPSRQAFYVWRFSCDKSTGNNPVAPGSIMRLDVEFERL
jgi:photosystem II stability/assembly factor-like uncharacterized protein